MDLYDKGWPKDMLKSKLTQISILASPPQANIQAACRSSCDHAYCPQMSWKEEKGSN